jgi:histidinol-phosphate aminotransferase
MPDIPDNIKNIEEYTLSDSSRLSYDEKENFLKLDWNEATYSPPEEVRDRLRQFLKRYGLNYYPDVTKRKLKRDISEYNNIDENYIEIFNGSDAAIRCILNVFLVEGDNLVVKEPVYTQPYVFVRSEGARVKSFLGKTPFKKALERYEKNIDEKTKCVYIPNPCNPTGVLLEPTEIRYLLEKFPRKTFIVDEAYYEFSGVSAADLVRNYTNLVITRTFSKAFALAGLRIGYIISHPSTLSTIQKVHNPKSVNTLAQVAARAALKELDYYRDKIEEVLKSKEWIKNRLKNMNLKCNFGHGNFFMVKSEIKDSLIQKLKKNKILVRDRGHLSQLDGYVRITVSTKNDMEKVVKELKNSRECD